MIDDFMYVLENYPDMDLSNEENRKTIATALANIMCEHHIVSYTDLDAARADSKMNSWIKHCATKRDERDIEKPQMDIPFERGL